MHASRIRGWLEIVGLFGVVGSLIFVGLEMRQAQQIAMSSANQARVDSTINFSLTLATDPFIRSVQAKLAMGKMEELTLEERIAFERIADTFLFIMENIHDQYLNGFITAQRWQGSLVNLEDGLDTPGMRDYFEKSRDGWSPQFQQLVDKIDAPSGFRQIKP